MASGTWTQTTGGNWNLATTGPWLSGIVADGATFTANFTSNITATTTVTLTESRTIGNLTLSDNGASGFAWTLAGSSTLTLDNGGSSPQISIVTATTISAPIAGTAGFTKTGAATLTVSSTNNTLFSGTITADAGNLVLGAYTSAPRPFPNATAYVVNSSAIVSMVATTAYTDTYPITVNDTSRFSGGFWATTDGATYQEFTGSITGIGSLAIDGGVQGVSAIRYPRMKTLTLPDSGRLILNSGSNSGTTIRYTKWAYGGAAATYNTTVILDAGNGTAGNIFVNIVNAGSGTLTLAGPITKTTGGTGASALMPLTFGTGLGDDLADIVVSGAITSTEAGNVSITKTGSRRLTLSGANTYTGATTISGGTLSAQSNGALGSAATGAVILGSGTTLDIAGSVTVTKTSTAVNLQGGTVQNTSGANTYDAATSPMTGSGTTFKIDGGSLAWKPTVSGALGVTKTGTETLRFDNAVNTYTGTTTISGGVVEVLRLANLSTSSSLGAPTTSANGTISMAAGTTLRHVGANEANSTERIISGSSAGALTIESSGTGTSSLTLATTNSGAITPFSTGNSTIIFGGTNTVANTCARALANPASSGSTAVTKTGSNTWILTGALSHTGMTTLSGGELRLGQTNRTLSGGLTVTEGTLSNGTSTVAAVVTMSNASPSTGGTITAELTGANNVTVSSGTHTFSPTNNANTLTSGATVAVASGATLQLYTGSSPATAGAGKVLGDAAVNVTGTLMTSSAGAQRGQMRYGGNLTFAAGAVLSIGGAS